MREILYSAEEINVKTRKDSRLCFYKYHYLDPFQVSISWWEAWNAHKATWVKYVRVHQNL